MPQEGQTIEYLLLGHRLTLGLRYNAAMYLRLGCVVTFSLALLPFLAFAATQDDEPVPPPSAGISPSRPLAPLPPPPPSPEPVLIGKRSPANHILEGTMGFIVGQRHYEELSFESQNNVFPGLTEAFLRSPYDATTIFGLRYDVRLTVTFIRMTIGVDVPFSLFRSNDTTAMYMIDGKGRTVTVQSLRPYELRFGLGGELPISVFAPFVDLIGAAHWVNTSLAVDGMKAEYQAQTFGFSLRAGCRLHVRKWFFAALSGEAGLYGPVRWNAELSVGFAAGK